MACAVSDVWTRWDHPAAGKPMEALRAQYEELGYCVLPNIFAPELKDREGADLAAWP